MAVYELAERNRHFLFHSAGVVDVARDAEELGAAVVWAAEGGEPARPSTHYSRADCDRLHVCHSGGTVEDA